MPPTGRSRLLAVLCLVLGAEIALLGILVVPRLATVAGWVGITVVIGSVCYGGFRFAVRARFRFTICTLMLAVFVVSLLLALLGRPLTESFQARRVANALTRSGGVVYSEFDEAPQSLLEGVLGKAAMSHITSIDFGGYRKPTLDGVELGVFERLNDISLENGGFTDADLVRVGQLRQLRGLNLASQMTDSGLAHLKGLHNLTGLKLNATRITNAGFVHLIELTSLERLIVNAGQLTPTSVEYLRQLPKLKGITVIDSTVTDTELSRLQDFHLIDRLRIRGAAVSDAGIDELQKALPHCEIHR